MSALELAGMSDHYIDLLEGAADKGFSQLTEPGIMKIIKFDRLDGAVPISSEDVVVEQQHPCMKQ